MSPLFAYQCRICGSQFDKFQPLGARDLASCPECSCVAERKLTPVNFTFGFRLSDKSQWVRGTKDELVRDI